MNLLKKIIYSTIFSQEQFIVLKQGSEVWNEWKVNNPDVEIDLNTIELTDGNLSGADLNGADLRQANLSKTDLSGADLRNTDLSGADLCGANLSQANFSNANLSGANLNEANLSGAILNGAKFIETIFVYANLSRATVRDAKFIRSNLSRSDLTQADFTNSNLKEANLIEANLNSACLMNVDFSDANLSLADFSDADLSSARLINSKLIGTNALSTNFRQIVLTGSCIQDWNINTETIFEDILCDYIYLKENQHERRPRNGNFSPDEFSILVQKSLETIDLVFVDGIDWQAFFQSFQELRSQFGNQSIGIQGIEKKDDSIVIHLETIAEVDKSLVESKAKELYNEHLQLIEQRYTAEIKAKDREICIYKKKSSDLNEIARLLATRPINVEATAVVQKDITHQTNINAKTIGAIHSGSGDLNNLSQIIGQDLDEISQIISKLRQIAQSFPTDQKEIAIDELEDLEHDIKTPENHHSKRIGRRLKGLLAAGTTTAAFAGTTMTGAVDLSSKADEFITNVQGLSKKLGIELVQSKKSS